MLNTYTPQHFKHYLAIFTNGKRRKLRALHLTQAQHMARGIARANAWNVKAVTETTGSN